MKLLEDPFSLHLWSKSLETFLPQIYPAIFGGVTTASPGAVSLVGAPCWPKHHGQLYNLEMHSDQENGRKNMVPLYIYHVYISRQVLGDVHFGTGICALRA